MSNVFSYAATHQIVNLHGEVMFSLRLVGNEELMMKRAQYELVKWCLARGVDNDEYTVVKPSAGTPTTSLVS